MSYAATHDAVGTLIASLSTDEINRRLSILRSSGSDGISEQFKRGYEKELHERAARAGL